MGTPAVDPVEDDGQATRCHWMLLRLAGHVPDEMLARCRQWLAEGRLTDVATTVAHTVVASGASMRTDDVALVAELHRAAGIDTHHHLRIPTYDVAPAPAFDFAAERPAGGPVGAAEDSDPGRRPTGTAGTAGTDGPVDAIRRAARSRPEVRALWCAWRFPANGAPWPPARRVFVVEVDASTGLARMTADLQRVLAEGGENAPRVEVYPVATQPPVYQHWARGSGALLHLRDARRKVRIAAVYDTADETGPSFAADHPRLDGEERLLVLDYLGGGEVLMSTSARIEDTLRPEAGQIVPITFRTDGQWVWSDAAWYYLHEHFLAPEQEFLEHIRRREYVLDEVDAVGLQLAIAELTRPADSEPVWTGR